MRPVDCECFTCGRCALTRVRIVRSTKKGVTSEMWRSDITFQRHCAERSQRPGRSLERIGMQRMPDYG